MRVEQDQAVTLRAMARQRQKSAPASNPPIEDLAQRGVRTIAVASGKGGVGKTNLVANLGIAFAQAGARVLAVDGDLGLANLDLTLGISARGHLLEVMEGDATVDEILTPARDGLSVLPACSGSYALANIDGRNRHNLFAAIDSLEERFDTLLIDTGAGIGTNAVAFASAAEHVVVVACPEPTSLADAYGLIKVLYSQSGTTQVHLVSNMVRNAAEGEEVYRQLSKLLGRFLNVGIDYLGAINHDQAVPRSIRAGVPVVVAEPNAPASRCIESIARHLAEPMQSSQHGGIRLFWKRLLDVRKAS